MKRKKHTHKEMRVGDLIARKKEVCSQERTSLGRYYHVGSDYYNIKFVQRLGTKYNLIHTLDTPNYKAHVPVLRNLKDKCTLWSKKHSKVVYQKQELFLDHFIYEFMASKIFNFCPTNSYSEE